MRMAIVLGVLLIILLVASCLDQAYARRTAVRLDLHLKKGVR